MEPNLSIAACALIMGSIAFAMGAMPVFSSFIMALSPAMAAPVVAQPANANAAAARTAKPKRCVIPLLCMCDSSSGSRVRRGGHEFVTNGWRMSHISRGGLARKHGKVILAS